MKFAFADTRSRCTELTAATARIPIQTPRKPTVYSVSARHSKNAKLLTVRVRVGYLAGSGNRQGRISQDSERLHGSFAEVHRDALVRIRLARRRYDHFHVSSMATPASKLRASVARTV